MSTDTQQIVNKAWNFARVLRDDGLSYMAYTEQIWIRTRKSTPEAGSCRDGEIASHPVEIDESGGVLHKWFLTKPFEGGAPIGSRVFCTRKVKFQNAPEPDAVVQDELEALVRQGARQMLMLWP
jgi:hypothetical protein